MATSISESEFLTALRDFAARIEQETGTALQLPARFDPGFPLEATGIDSLLTAELAVDLEQRLTTTVDFPGLLAAENLGDVLDTLRKEGA